MSLNPLGLSIAACPGLHRLVHVMREHLDDAREEHIQASCAIHWLVIPNSLGDPDCRERPE